MATAPDTIGREIGRADGPDKVTGRGRYPADIHLPGMLVGKCLRSPYPYARIASIDVCEARRLPGVHAVLTGADLPEMLVGRALRDIPVLARDVVRFAGQKVAAVAADSLGIAEEALSLIEVEYEELEPVLDPLAAMAPDAPTLHPDFAQYVGRVEGEQEHPNVTAHARWHNGDVERGFAEADRVFEHEFRTAHQHQGYIEPHATVLRITNDDRVEVWANSKVPFQLRRQIAAGIDLPEDRVRINAALIGGDFGGKGGFMDTHVCYWLARATGRPIRMTMSYTEELTAANPRHPAVMTFKTGVTRDGTITARQARLVFESGGYAAFKPVAGIMYGRRCLGPYRMEHGCIDAYMVYTNHVPCGSMRSPGDPQSVFASEAQIDLIARELGIDPYDFRLKNLVRDGDLGPLGQSWKNVMATRTLEAAVRESGYHGPRHAAPGRKLGRGMAICERAAPAGVSPARLVLSRDSTLTFFTALRDTGTGFYTVLRQIVGRELSVPIESIRVETWSTDDTKFDTGVSGSRVTNVGGHAALGVARALRDKLAALAAEKYGGVPDAIRFEDGRAIAGDFRVALVELARASGGSVEADYTYEGEADPSITNFSSQVAEVEVDEETGEVKLVRFTTAHDVGEILNPVAHQGQIEGGLVQGIGAALLEEIQYEDGRVLNPSLGEYKLPTIRDIPELRTVLLRSETGGPAPYGGKPIGEQSISNVAPAIANAVLDATGVSVRDLPITAEKVLRLLGPPGDGAAR